MNTDDILIKRAILLSARFRFAPESQPIKEAEIDKIVEQCLLLANSDKGLTEEEIFKQDYIMLEDGAPVITLADLSSSLNRLISSKRLILDTISNEKRYRLAENVLIELKNQKKIIEDRFNKIIETLFKNSKKKNISYKEPFIECLCHVFSQLTETYIRLLKGEITLDDLLQMPNIQNALKNIFQKYTLIEKPLFESAMYEFFQESNPDYDAVKWDMAQNYFVAKILGLDPNCRLLSREVLGESVLYLDTNVIIHALERSARHYRSFQSLAKACEKIGIKLKVCKITIDELDSVIQYKRQLLIKVIDQIPDEIESKISGTFFKLFREKKKESKDEEVDINSIFENFLKPIKDLTEFYAVELVDESWFEIAKNDAATNALISKLQNSYKKIRGREKSFQSSMHDALLLRWIEKERRETDRNVLLVTLDTSLPSLSIEEDSINRGIAITLDALLQWISPIAMRDSDEAAAIFSEIVKYQLLPRAERFSMRDFLIFAEMEWACKELPAKDVEDCIRYLKANLSNLDPSKAEDREKMALEISKFFADPGRKFKHEIQKLEEKIREKEKEIKEREKRVKELEKQKIESDLKRSAQIRFITSLLITLFLTSLAIAIAALFGRGTNFFQKLADLWILPTVAFAFSIFLSRLIIGKEKLKYLEWPLSKLFKM